jgi:hypothetical protein
MLLGCYRRYLVYLSALDNFPAGIRALGRLTRPRAVDGKTVKRINLFAPADKEMLQALPNPTLNIATIRRGDPLLVPRRFPRRQLRRLHPIGVNERVRGTCRYCLTRAVRAATAAACRLTDAIIIPALIWQDFLMYKVSRVE